MARRKLRLLVAVDFSPEARNALRVARDLVSRTGGTLTVAHVRPLSNARAAIVEERGELLRAPARTLDGAIAGHYEERLRSVTRADAGESFRLLRGKPSLELCREARRGYDMLVMGSRGRGKVASSLLGSTVQEVLARPPVPVLVVRPR